MRRNFKKLSIICLIAISITFIAVSTNNTVPANAIAEGDGSTFNPYVIMNCEDLQDIENDLNAYYLLGQNIDCSMTNPADGDFNNAGTWADGKGFVPISLFVGQLNGSGYSIDQLFIDRPTTDNVGLFSTLNAATIKNFLLTNADITCQNVCAPLAANAQATAVVRDIYVSGFNRSVSSYVGGAVGELNNSAISRVAVDTVVSVDGADSYCGGIVGSVIDATIMDSYYNGAVKCGNAGGGIAGLANNSRLIRVFARGSVTNSTSTAGGLVGSFNGTGDASSGAQVINSFAINTVTSSLLAGGLFGDVDDTDNVTNSYYDAHGIAAIGCGTADSDCTAINTNSVPDATYFSSNSNTPMSLWDFDAVWNFDVAWPNLNMANFSPPTNFEANVGEVPTTQIGLDWDEQLKMGGATVTSYWISWREAGSGDPFIRNYQINAAGNYHQGIMTNLDPNTTYELFLQSQSSEGLSYPTSPITFTTMDLPNGNVSTCEDLQNINSDLDLTYTLAGNIDCSASADWNGGDGFRPIGRLFQPFTGVLFGDGHNISDLFINNKFGGDYVGLFGNLDTALIQGINIVDGTIRGNFRIGSVFGFSNGSVIDNVNVENTSVKAENWTDNRHVGGIGGGLDEASTLTNSSFTGNNVVGGTDVGGLVGSCFNAVIRDSDFSNGAVETLEVNAGGIVGSADQCSLENVSATDGNVDGYQFIGGVAGLLENSEVSGSQSSLNVTGTLTNTFFDNDTNRYVGGFVGNTDNSNFDNNSASGNVSNLNENTASTGGFVGLADVSDFNSNEATGDVIGSDNNSNNSDIVGGFVGLTQNSNFINNFASGNVFGGYDTGGFAGQSTLSTFDNGYASGDVNSQLGTAGGYIARVYSGNFYDLFAAGEVNGGFAGGGFAGVLDITDIFDTSNLLFTSQSAGTNNCVVIANAYDIDCTDADEPVSRWYNNKDVRPFVNDVTVAQWDFYDTWYLNDNALPTLVDGDRHYADPPVITPVCMCYGPNNLSVDTASPGQQITVTGTSWLPGSDVVITLESTPVYLATAKADAQGNFSVVVTIPKNTPLGQHHIVMTGLRAANDPVVISIPIRIEKLANTGFSGISMFWSGFGVLIFGFAVFLFSKKRLKTF